MRRLRALMCVAAVLALAPSTQAAGFEKLFNGKDLTGWTLVGKAGPGYVVEDGALLAPADGGGNLYTDKDYSDFIFRFEFKTDKAGNNGIALRAATDQGNASFEGGMEVQVLDDYDPIYANLLPGQYCGSIYKIAAAKRGATKPAGQWNREEITARGRHITIKMNGKVIVDVDLNKVTSPEVLAEHPGMLRDRGRLGFLGHGPSAVWFRNIEVKDLSVAEKPNTAPAGFTTLFDGKTLKGWKGLVGNPETRAKMEPEALKAAEAKATVTALEHWKVIDGVIVYDGKNDSLCTVKDYADFEMLVDWKILPGGDSGVYLRGSPQIQIWDTEVGSGALYNNQKNPSKPTTKADKAPGEWNRFRILMVGERVTVFLNDVLIVHNVVMENYWDRSKSIYPAGQLELQHHGAQLEWKNIYVRELPAATE
jgi:hypothetical protein